MITERNSHANPSLQRGVKIFFQGKQTKKSRINEPIVLRVEEIRKGLKPQRFLAFSFKKKTLKAEEELGSIMLDSHYRLFREADWCKTAKLKAFSKERSERCGWLTGSVAK